jgi:hypothetical protein
VSPLAGRMTGWVEPAVPQAVKAVRDGQVVQMALRAAPAAVVPGAACAAQDVVLRAGELQDEAPRDAKRAEAGGPVPGPSPVYRIALTAGTSADKHAKPAKSSNAGHAKGMQA